MALPDPSLLVDGEDGREADGHQVGQDAGVRTGAPFSVSTASFQIKPRDKDKQVV